jgi:chromosome segregation ATPase
LSSHSPDYSPTSPSQAHPSASDANGDAPTSEWSAVGHAATGKSGRVIHNLQEEIARLTRECTLYKSRAEEYQRTNEAYKIQQQNTNERIRNLEQVNDTNLNSIARKDRKLEELRIELQHERNKRQDAEKDANQTNQTMFEERETHNRELARSQEIAKYYETQYEVLSSSNKREKADFAKRINAIWAEVEAIAGARKTHMHSTERLEVLADQKNREVDSLKDSYEKLVTKHTEYKEMKENEFRGTINSAKSNNAAIDKVLAQLKETETEMKWAIRLHKSREGNE